MKPSGTPDRVRTTETVFNIIQTIHREDTMSLTALATELDMAKSTIHRHLKTLEELEYVTEHEREYRIGFRFLELGEHTRTSFEPYQMARQKVKELAAETHERAQFIVEEHGRGVYVHRKTGEQAVRTDSRVGKRVPLHSISAGKAILAHLPQSRVEEIVERHGLEQITTNTITDEDELFEELEQIKHDGFSVNAEESTEGLYAIGVPVQYENERILGALSVAAPVHRFNSEDRQETIKQLILGTANELELNIRYPNRVPISRPNHGDA